MSRKTLHVIFLSAWLVATGGVWDLVQVAAWGGMFAQRLENMTVLEAARQTFLPDQKCNLCLAVEDGKRTQEESAGVAGGEFSSKAPIVIQSTGRVAVNPPDGVSTMRVEPGHASYRRETPPLPPPRA